MITDNSCGYRALFLGVKYYELEIKNNSRDPESRSLTRSADRQKAGAGQLMDALQEWLAIKRQEFREQIELREYIPPNETLEEAQIRRQREYDRRYHAFQVERGEALPSEEKENEYLFNIEFDFILQWILPLFQYFKNILAIFFPIDCFGLRTMKKDSAIKLEQWYSEMCEKGE